jgi:hypothetical protein
MCDEARGCRETTGNFRRVCPMKRAPVKGERSERLGYCAACSVNPNKTNANTSRSKTGFSSGLEETPGLVFARNRDITRLASE